MGGRGGVDGGAGERLGRTIQFGQTTGLRTIGSTESLSVTDKTEIKRPFGGGHDRDGGEEERASEADKYPVG